MSSQIWVECCQRNEVRLQLANQMGKTSATPNPCLNSTKGNQATVENHWAGADYDGSQSSDSDPNIPLRRRFCKLSKPRNSPAKIDKKPRINFGLPGEKTWGSPRERWGSCARPCRRRGRRARRQLRGCGPAAGAGQRGATAGPRPAAARGQRSQSSGGRRPAVPSVILPTHRSLWGDSEVSLVRLGILVGEIR